MTQTQHIALAISVVTVCYGLIVLAVLAWRRRDAWTPVFAFARVNGQQVHSNVFTAFGNSPEESAFGTREVSLIQGPPKWRRRLTMLMVPLVLVAALGVGFVVGNGYGKNHVVNAALNRTGWLLSSFNVDGAVTPATTETVFLFWNNTSHPNDPNVDWYLIDPTKTKHPLLADIKVSASDNGQHGIVLIAHTGSGDVTINGTLNDATLQLEMRPNALLFPAVPTAFFTMTFALSNTNAYNQLIGGA